MASWDELSETTSYKEKLTQGNGGWGQWSFDETPQPTVPVVQELVFESNGQPVTSSTIVAHEFEKQHKHILESIRNLMAENSAVRNYFVETTYVSSRGRDEPVIFMNREGFSLLVMGFTGSRALQFKIDFIEAFKKMEAIIKSKFEPKRAITGDELIAIGQELNRLNTCLQIAEAKIEEDKPKVKYADRVQDTGDAMTMQAFAALISRDHGINIGRNDLFEWLRWKGYL